MPSRLRFPRPFHLRRNRDFGHVYRRGQRARGSILLLVGAPNDLGHPRLGLSVSKKIWKHAVKRNRVRRVFREAFRLAARELPPFDFVLIPAEPRLEPNTPDTLVELQRLAKKIAKRAAKPGQGKPTKPTAANGKAGPGGPL